MASLFVTKTIISHVRIINYEIRGTAPGDLSAFLGLYYIFGKAFPRFSWSTKTVLIHSGPISQIFDFGKNK